MTSPLITTARNIAERAHEGQKRKSLGRPYFTHLEAVVKLLESHGYTDEVTLAAAYLHDVVEDQPAFAEEMQRAMPATVVETVRALTEPKRDAAGAPLAKRERFDAYVRGLSEKTAATERALPISCADKIHNTLSIIEAEGARERLLLALTTRPGEHRHNLARLRVLYAPVVAPSLLAAFDDAAGQLAELIRVWFPGRAAQIAAEAHLGQFDKAGVPYIFHPMRLAIAATGDVARTAALLHDVVEDSDWTLDALEREGCPEAVLRAVDALTRRPDETYDGFISRVACDRVATRVKLLDLEHNADLGRFPSPTDGDRARVEKYRRAAERLRRELDMRSLYVVLAPESVDAARSSARLEVLRGEHVTLAHRVDPTALDPKWIPGGLNVGDRVAVRVVAEAADDRVQVFAVEIGGSRVRPFDGGALHLTVSRSRAARSRDASDLLARGTSFPPRSDLPLLEGVIAWTDD